MPGPPNSFLAVSKNVDGLDLPVTQVEIENGISSGVKYDAFAGLVPFYEEHAARLERGINLRDWSAMDVIEKALVVAHRRVTIAVRNLQGDAEARYLKKASGRRGRV